jgi:hypothetical protein
MRKTRIDSSIRSCEAAYAATACIGDTSAFARSYKFLRILYQLLTSRLHTTDVVEKVVTLCTTDHLRVRVPVSALQLYAQSLEQQLSA